MAESLPAVLRAEAGAHRPALVGDAREAIRAMPPTVTQIDAPSTLIAELWGHIPKSTLDIPPSGLIRLETDNGLGLHMVRLHWSDGTAEVVRLGEHR